MQRYICQACRRIAYKPVISKSDNAVYCQKCFLEKEKNNQRIAIINRKINKGRIAKYIFLALFAVSITATFFTASTRYRVLWAILSIISFVFILCYVILAIREYAMQCRINKEVQQLTYKPKNPLM